MLWILRSETGQLQAACEWHLANERGQLCVDGRYVWLEQFELSQRASLVQSVRQMIQEIAQRCPWAVAAYWKRDDKSHPVHLQFSREAVLHYAQKEVMV